MRKISKRRAFQSLDEFWARWLAQHPHKREEMEEARWCILRTRELLKSSSTLSPQKHQSLQDRISKTLDLLQTQHEQSGQNNKMN